MGSIVTIQEVVNNIVIEDVQSKIVIIDEQSTVLISIVNSGAAVLPSNTEYFE